MAGGKRRSNSAKNQGESSDGNGGRGNDRNSNNKRFKLTEPKAKNSPRKMGKGKKKRERRQTPDRSVTEARFEEDGNEVVVELNGADERDFPSGGEESASNSQVENPAVVATDTEDSDHDDSEDEEEGEIEFNTSRQTPGRDIEMEPQPSTSGAERSPAPARRVLSDEELINQAAMITLRKMQELMEANRPNAHDSSGVASGARPKDNNQCNGKNKNNSRVSESETTVYDRAVMPEDENKRDSTSSEDMIDTSDECMEIPTEILPPCSDNRRNIVTNNNIISGQARGQGQYNRNGPQQRNCGRDPPRPSPEEEAQARADNLVRQAEASKARILELPGNVDDEIVTQGIENIRNEIPQGANQMSVANPHQHFMVDENYLVVGNYIEDNLRERIENGEYVDFARLLPRDRVQLEDESRMEMVFKNGRTYFVPATTHSNSDNAISSFSRWEQAFRVFSNVYTNRFPHRASKLIQYNHIIYTASMAFSWDNVYLYDREFRLHMARYPLRSWAMILQQAWTMRLRDKLKGDQNYGRSEKKQNKKDICWRYNKGRCTYGSSCKFDHRCGTCNKYGHGQHICRKANKDKNEKPGDDMPKFNRSPRGRSPPPPPPPAATVVLKAK